MLIGQRYLAVNPFLETELPKKDAAWRLLITEEELEVLLDAAGRQRDPTTPASASEVTHAGTHLRQDAGYSPSSY
jgi:hypothetical protein